MIWHIFRKDLKLLWPLVAALAAIQLLSAFLQYARWHFISETMSLYAGPLSSAVLLGIAILIAVNVHQDVIPGVCQDWLVRPIRRRDLLLAKLLFLIFAIHGPMLLVDLTRGIASGFPFSDSLSAALSRNIFILAAVSVPVFAVAAMTANMVEIVGGMLAIFLAGIALVFCVLSIRGWNEGSGPLAARGLSWMFPISWLVIALAAALVIIPLQYFRRATVRARAITVCGIFLIPISIVMPFSAAWSFQQWISVGPDAAQRVAVKYDPTVGRYKPPVRSDIFYYLASDDVRRTSFRWLPLSIAGLPKESVVITDHVGMRVSDGSGRLIYAGTAHEGARPGGGLLEDLSTRTPAGGTVRLHQLITLPPALLRKVQSTPVRIELDYSLTLFRLADANRFPATADEKYVPGFGRCRSSVDPEGTQLSFLCQTAGRAPNCFFGTLEVSKGGASPPTYVYCGLDYSPVQPSLLVDMIEIFNGQLSLTGDQAMAVPALEIAAGAKAQLSLKSYRPVAHFNRHVVLTGVRLSDWESLVEPDRAGG